MGGGNKGTLGLFYVLNSVRRRKELKGWSALPPVHMRLVLRFFFFFLPRIRSCVPSVCSPWRLAALQEYRPWSEKATFVSSKEPSCRWWEEPSLLLFLNQVTSASGTPMETKICFYQTNGRWIQDAESLWPPHPALQEASAWASSTVLQPNQISHLGFLLVSRAF